MERHFEDHEMAMLYQKYRLDYKGTSVGKDIVNLLYKQLKKDTYSLAVDTGCGTGFLARLLAPHFSKILGVDVSEAQIKVAKDVTEAQNVEYRVCRAEKMPFLGNNTVDLVTVAMAIQHLDTNEFFVEVDRVLKPGGCLAVIMYEYRQGCCMVALKASDTQHSAVNDKLQSLVEEISFLGVQQLGSGSKKMFQNKTLPCPNYPTSHHLQVSTEREGVLSDIMGYLKSKGGLRMYQKQHTEDGNIYDQYEQRFVSVLKEVSPFPDTVRLTIGTVLHCHVYRKPLIPHQ